MSLSELQKENAKLKKQLEESQARAARRDARVAHWKNAYQTLEVKLEAKSTGENDSEEGEGRGTHSEREDDSDLEVLWDENDHIWRCSDCFSEIDGNTCMGCEARFSDMEEEDNEFSCSTISQAETYDRVSHRRGSTPLLDAGHIRVPDRWVSRRGEYCELIKRGATALMCDTFHLEFTKDGGIYAYADQALFDEFSGEAMKKGDEWKIYLGRRLQLDVDDHDGSEFIEGLLEDALLFNSGKYRWETVKEDGEWITRPTTWMDGALKTSDVESSEESDEESVTVDNEKEQDKKEVESGNVENEDGEDKDDSDYEDDESTDDGGAEGDGGKFVWNTDYTTEFKTWVHGGRYDHPETGLAIVEDRYYDTDDDQEDDASVHPDPSNDIDIDMDAPEGSQASNLQKEGSGTSITLATSPSNADEDMESESSYDSDFNSDENMSGDDPQVLRRRAEAWFPDPPFWR